MRVTLIILVVGFLGLEEFARHHNLGLAALLFVLAAGAALTYRRLATRGWWK